jgi:phytoene desaturase
MALADVTLAQPAMSTTAHRVRRGSRPRAVVIGSGFGGLAAAIRLQAAGVATTLVERHDQPGGRARVWRDQGFTFDAGPTVITAPECLEELFTLAGRRIEDYVTLVPVRPFYRLFWEDGYTFDYSNDAAATFEQIRARSPADVDGYRRFLDYTADVFEHGYTRLAHVPFLDWWSMLRVAPQLVRLQAYRSVYGAVSRFIRDPHLRQAFSFHSLLVGGNPFSAPSIYTLIHFLERRWGVFFPLGGTGALVRGLVRLFEDLGGELWLGAEVEAIETSAGRVSGARTRDGRRAEAATVVSNADVVHTYARLLGHEPRGRAQGARLGRARHGMSLFLVYFGTRRRHTHLAHHDVLFGPRYRGLLDDIFAKGRLSDDFSLYLHAPTVTDPSLAPGGCEAFYVLAPVPHLDKARIDWGVEGPRYAERILDYLEKRYIPGLRGDLVTQRIFTPEDFRRELHAHAGSAFSLEPVLTQSAYFRVHNRDARMGGLYFVGAGTHPGAGIPGVVNSAKATAGLVLRDLGLSPERSVAHVQP